MSHESSSTHDGYSQPNCKSSAQTSGISAENPKVPESLAKMFGLNLQQSIRIVDENDRESAWSHLVEIEAALDIVEMLGICEEKREPDFYHLLTASKVATYLGRNIRYRINEVERLLRVGDDPCEADNCIGVLPLPTSAAT